MWQQTLAWILGIAFSHQSSALPPLWAWVLGLLLCGCWAMRASSPLIWLTAGLLCGWGHGLWLQPPFEFNRNLRLQLELIEPQSAKPWGQSWLAEVYQVDQQSLWPGRRFRLWVRFAADLPLAVGERWQLQGQIQPLSSLHNFEQRSSELWLLSQNIRGRITAKQPQPLSAAAGLPVYRQQIAAQLLVHQTEFPQTHLLPAILLGQYQGLTDQDWQRWRESGTLHLLVVSGGHLSVIAWLLALLGRRLWTLWPQGPLYYPANLVGLWSGLLGAALFVVLVGNQLALWRAWLMLLLAATLWLARRRWQPWTIWHGCLRLMLLAAPLSLYVPGFWLSLVAVALIFVATARGAGLIGVQWLLSIGLLPWLAVWFHQIYPYGFLVNLLAIPLISLVVLPCGLLWLVLAALPVGGEGYCAWAIEQALAAIQWSQDLTRGWPAANWPVASDLGLQFGLALTCLLVLLPRRLFSPLLALSLAGLSLVMLRTPGSPPDGLTITLLDVGQGLSVLIETPQQVLLYDTGPPVNAGYSVPGAALAARGWRKLDLLMLSHEQQDHVGGLAALSAAIAIERIWRVPDGSCRRGQQWSVQELRVQVLFPPPEARLAANDGSCVVLVRWRDLSLLLTGDLTDRSERALLTLEPDLQADLLQLAHHGSRYSSSWAWLRQIQPQLALAGIGRDNRYGFPHPATLNRLAVLKIPLSDTARFGAVRVHWQANGIWQWSQARPVRDNWLRRLSHGREE